MQKNYFVGSLIVQCLLIFAVFHHIILEGEQYLFSNHHDGLKNYFTYYTYLLQAKHDNPFIYSGMNYPFGDYIFYTDNTPLFAFLIKWIKALNLILITKFIEGK